jgi:outer membrane protein assembly factor BamE (lipoprotein component of BamABCDE complex)
MIKLLSPILVSGFLSVWLLSACTPTQTTRGNMPEAYRIAQVEPGVSTRSEVMRLLGSPTTQAPFDENVWYYLGQKMEKRGVFDPKVVDEQIVVVAFDPEGIVDVVEELDTRRMDIPKVRRKTHTGGNEVTFIQQLLGNVGRFNRPAEE